MADEIFTEPAESTDEWVDVRMTDPDEGEWDVDVVVMDGTVQYIDLRLQPNLLADFVDCLVADLSEERAKRVLANLADRRNLDLTVQDE